MTGKYLITTVPAAGRCGRCQSWILIGVSEGLWARVDPFPLERRWEIVALLSGRSCFTLTARTLIERDGYLRPGLVLAEHRCGQRLGYSITKPPAAPTPEYPPF